MAGSGMERLAVLGVTAGCATGPARYCPDESVTRAQMATFLTRAIEGGRPGSGLGRNWWWWPAAFVVMAGTIRPDEQVIQDGRVVTFMATQSSQLLSSGHWHTRTASVYSVFGSR